MRAKRRLERLLWGIVACCACGEGASRLDGPTCSTRVTRGEIAVAGIDRVDVLFAIDGSPSMREEQAALQRELPAIIERFVTGKGPDGRDTQPLRDLHVGVVSTDLGAMSPDRSVPGCSERGDDGLLGPTASASVCEPSYPAFVSYRPPLPTEHPLIPESLPDVSALARDFACISALGTQGCGYSQPLEAALVALWPPLDAEGRPLDPERIGFASGRLGRGDRDNAGFLRSDRRSGVSYIVIAAITDKDDCSAADADVFAGSVDGRTPEARCATQAALLHPVSRYFDALRALRPSNEDLVAFAAITGIPPDLVGPEALAAVDRHDDAAVDRFYRRVLDDPRMQPEERADGTLAPACESELASASPAPRLVQLARAFGQNGSIHSICEGGWSRVFDSLLANTTARTLGAVCLPRPVPRGDDALVPCTITWELPPPDAALEGTPVACDEALGLVPHPTRSRNERGGAVCVLRQLAVTGLPDAPALEAGPGWFYDDFSEVVRRSCIAGQRHTIVTVPHQAPLGVVVKLECVEQNPVFPAAGELDPTLPQPAVFDACDPADPGACARALANPRGEPGIDRGLFCHPVHAQCVPVCPARGCPAGWQCNGDAPVFCEPGECRVP